MGTTAVYVPAPPSTNGEVPGRDALVTQMDGLRQEFVRQRVAVRDRARNCRTEFNLCTDGITEFLRAVELPTYGVGTAKALEEMSLPEFDPELFSERGLSVKYAELHAQYEVWRQRVRERAILHQQNGQVTTEFLDSAFREIGMDPPRRVTRVDASVAIYAETDAETVDRSQFQDALRPKIQQAVESMGFRMRPGAERPVTVTARVTQQIG